MSRRGVEVKKTVLILDNFSMISVGMFSSANNEGFLESNISFIFDSFGSKAQGRENSLLTNLRKISLKNFINGDSCREQFYYLPDHDSRAFKSGSTSTNLSVCNNVLVNFDSHNFSNVVKVFKDYEFKLMLFVLFYFFL